MNPTVFREIAGRQHPSCSDACRMQRSRMLCEIAGACPHCHGADDRRGQRRPILRQHCSLCAGGPGVQVRRLCRQIRQVKTRVVACATSTRETGCKKEPCWPWCSRRITRTNCNKPRRSWRAARRNMTKPSLPSTGLRALCFAERHQAGLRFRPGAVSQHGGFCFGRAGAGERGECWRSRIASCGLPSVAGW